jgi:hypothetical protein
MDDHQNGIYFKTYKHIEIIKVLLKPLGATLVKITNDLINYKWTRGNLKFQTN